MNKKIISILLLLFISLLTVLGGIVIGANMKKSVTRPQPRASPYEPPTDSNNEIIFARGNVEISENLKESPVFVQIFTHKYRMWQSSRGDTKPPITIPIREATNPSLSIDFAITKDDLTNSGYDATDVVDDIVKNSNGKFDIAVFAYDGYHTFYADCEGSRDYGEREKICRGKKLDNALYRSYKIFPTSTGKDKIGGTIDIAPSVIHDDIESVTVYIKSAKDNPDKQNLAIPTLFLEWLYKERNYLLYSYVVRDSDLKQSPYFETLRSQPIKIYAQIKLKDGTVAYNDPSDCKDHLSTDPDYTCFIDPNTIEKCVIPPIDSKNPCLKYPDAVSFHLGINLTNR